MPQRERVRPRDASDSGNVLIIQERPLVRPILCLIGRGVELKAYFINDLSQGGVEQAKKRLIGRRWGVEALQVTELFARTRVVEIEEFVV